ncbi:MAG TPA: PIN domain-containing protein [Solirubrobacter sp.]|nr:PIN domain-containing protein [Solirubrobacter sp.]
MAASSSPVAYLDSSALVKLIVVEAETAALRRELLRWPHRVSSALTAVELTRAAQRIGPHAVPLAARVPAGIDLLSIDAVVPAAMRVGSNLLRSLDAIHLATAASISGELQALITYDRRILADAQTMGLPVLAPR